MRAPLPLVSLALTSLLACSKPAPPTLVPVSASVTELTPVGVNLSVSVNATNPNSGDLTSQAVSAHVVLDKTLDLGTVTSSQAISLPGGQTTLIKVPLAVPWNSVAALVQLGATNRPVPYAIDGTVAMGGALVNLSLPFHLDGVITHEQVVSATMRSIPGAAGLGLPR